MKILLGTLLTVGLLFAGCSEKSKDDGDVSIRQTIPMSMCKSNIKTTNDGWAFTGMTMEQFDNCMIRLKAEKRENKEASVAGLDLSKFGVQNSYEVNEEEDLKKLKKILGKVYEFQYYTSDDAKYDRGDMHEDISYYIDFLEKNQEHRENREAFKKLYKKAGYSKRHFTFIDGKWWVTGDCETTFRAIETYAIRDGINPQRLFEIYCEVMTDSAKTTPAGGHMFGWYVGASGKVYTLEQLPDLRTAYELSTQRYYKFIEQRRCDQPVGSFQPIHPQQIKDIDNQVPIKLRTTNEVK